MAALIRNTPDLTLKLYPVQVSVIVLKFYQWMHTE
ncbi:hypothetical protein CLV25_10181 [Acetobacteroides hydrogenigenes]|uniref:Uncharacterized protein n=1 Tax=Acetobacteroides hydrogenigenes TaxID=979970 RepID=A0A4R2EZ10_9BACT|nr:hypothetical protein CLV25_10181 [Acetobacteroides hydrogenigenes]